MDIKKKFQRRKCLLREVPIDMLASLQTHSKGIEGKKTYPYKEAKVPPPSISRRGVLGLSAVAAVAATAAVTTTTVMADETKDSKESKDVKPMVIECLADLNRSS